jgi:hypothetical protein
LTAALSAAWFWRARSSGLGQRNSGVYEKTRADLNGRELVIDLKHITAINQEGENVLFELMSKGVKFCGRGVFTKQILKQVASRARKSLQQRER